MNLKSLVHREICEGMTEEQVASSVGVSLRTIEDILKGKDPKVRSIWEAFARYFRMDVDFLRTGESTYVKREHHVLSLPVEKDGTVLYSVARHRQPESGGTGGITQA
jgi:hypothetical protein